MRMAPNAQRRPAAAHEFRFATCACAGRAAAFTATRGASRMKIRPLHDRVIVKRLEEERKTASGIVIPDTAAEKPDQGEIMAVGTGKVLENGKVLPLDVKVGDRVLFGKYSGQTVKVKGEELLVMREEDIMGVVEGK
jgi:chaperonin GroES